MFLMLADMGAVIDEQPGAQYQEAGGEGQEMDGIEQIKRAAGERQQWKVRMPPGRRSSVWAKNSSKASPRKKLNPSSSATLVGEGAVIMAAILRGATDAGEAAGDGAGANYKGRRGECESSPAGL